MHVFGGDLSKWNILRSRKGQEQKVATLLSRKRIINFCPSDFAKRVRKPLFPTYVFVKITPLQIDQVLKIRGVEGFVFSLGKRAWVADEIITMLGHLTQETRVLHVSKIDVDFHTKENFLFGERSYSNTKHPVDKYSFKVSFPTLGYSLIMETEDSSKEPSFIHHFHPKEQRI